MAEQGLQVVEGVTVPVLSGDQMVDAFQRYKELQNKLDKSMPEQLMEIGPKKFRKKGYWRAIAVAFNLTVEPIDERREVSGQFDDGRENFGYVITYKASTQSGRSATGDGACFAIEKAQKFRCPHPQPDNPNRTVHYPAENCPEFANYNSWARLSPQATEHNIRSHAHTRAFNRAVSNLVGFGEVSAEEIPEEERAAHAQQAGSGATTQAQQQKTETKPTGTDGSTTVKAVKPKSDKKPAWITFGDGREASTFDDKLIEQAQALVGKDTLVIPKIEKKEKGGKTYHNVMGLEPVVQQKAGSALDFGPDTEPVGQPEKVLMTPQERATTGGTKYWAIQTDRRVYVTDTEGRAIVAKDAREAGKKVIVTFDRKGEHNVVTNLEVVDAA